MNTSPARMLLGFAVVPVTATLISLASYDMFWHMGLFPLGGPVHSLGAAGSVIAGVAVLAAIMTLTAAVPGVLWLQRRGWVTFGNVVLFGAVAGNLPFVLIVAGIVVALIASGTSTDLAGSWEGLSGTLVRSAMGSIAGASSAAAFWLVSMCGKAGAALEPQ